MPSLNTRTMINRKKTFGIPKSWKRTFVYVNPPINYDSIIERNDKRKGQPSEDLVAQIKEGLANIGYTLGFKII